MSLDEQNNVVLVGGFENTLDFSAALGAGGAGGGATLQSAGGADLFVAKFDPAGALMWSKRFGDAADQCQPYCGIRSAVDGNENIFIASSLATTIDFGKGVQGGFGDSDVFIVKLDKNGSCHWSFAFGDSYSQRVNAIAALSLGQFAISGTFAGTLDFGGSCNPLVDTSTNQTGDVFLAKFNASGECEWSRSYGDSIAAQYNAAIAADAADNIVIGGQFSGTINFGGTLLQTNATDIHDLYLAKFDANANHLWSHGFDVATTIPYWYLVNVTVDSQQQVLTAGYLNGDVDFGGGLLQANSYDSADGFIAKFSP